MNTFTKILLILVSFGYSCTVVFAHKEHNEASVVNVDQDALLREIGDKARQFANHNENVNKFIDELLRSAVQSYKKDHAHGHSHGDDKKKVNKTFIVELYERIMSEMRKAILDSAGKIINTTASVLAMVAGISLAVSIVLALDNHTGCIPGFGNYVLIPLASRGIEVTKRISSIYAEALLTGVSDATGLPVAMLFKQVNSVTNYVGD